MFTRCLPVCAALLQSGNTNYMLRKSKGARKKNTSATVLEPTNTLFFFSSSEVDLHYMFVWSLTFEKQAMKYESARTEELEASL